MATADSAAAVLPPADREPFLDAVARQLAGHEPGPGAEHRAVVTVFHAVWKPPETTHGASSWARKQTPSSKARDGAPIEADRGPGGRPLKGR